MYEYLFTPLQQPEQRLTELIFSTLRQIWETFGKHYEHELHILLPISSIIPAIFVTSTTYFVLPVSRIFSVLPA
jgi:hypothetical protein